MLLAVVTAVSSCVRLSRELPRSPALSPEAPSRDRFRASAPTSSLPGFFILPPLSSACFASSPGRHGRSQVAGQRRAGPSVAVSGSQKPAPAAGSPRVGRRRRAKPRFVPSAASLCPCSLPLPWCGRPPWPLHRGAHSASACPRLRSALFFSQHRMYLGPLVFLTNSSVLGVD